MYVLNMTCFLILLMYMHTCACKTDDVEAVMQSTCVRAICVYDDLHEHVCMSVMHACMSVYMHVDIHMNYKPRMTLLTL